jgi:hypothetical protein
MCDVSMMALDGRKILIDVVVERERSAREGT